jgi:phage-related protein
MSAFIWKHDKEPTGETEFRVVETQFGDGYAQRAPDGINHKSSTWPLDFTGTTAEITPIRDFLDSMGGCIPFDWTPPLGAAGRFLASKYSLTSLGNGVYRLSVTFNQDFAP